MENANTITPKNPNSNPLNGRTARNPPNPKMLNNPKAQEGQAGANILTIIPDDPIPAPNTICFRNKKILIETTIPANSEISTKNNNEIGSTFLTAPFINAQNKCIENSFFNNL